MARMEYCPHSRIFFSFGGVVCVRGLCTYGGVYEGVGDEAEVACWGYDDLSGSCVIMGCLGGGRGGGGVYIRGHLRILFLVFSLLFCFLFFLWGWDGVWL